MLVFALLANLSPQIEKAKKAVVCIEARVAVAPEDRGMLAGTGFIISKENGNIYIITNAHIARGDGMTSLELMTEDGRKQIQAQHIFTHPLLDFSLLKVNKEDAEKIYNAIEALKIDPTLPQMGQKVHVIGYPEKNSFTVDSGVISNTTEADVGYFPGRFVRVTITSVGGYSGGPVLNDRGEAQALIFAGSKTSLWAIPLSYFVDMIETLKTGSMPQVANPGFYLGYISADDAVKKYKLPQEVALNYSKNFPDGFNRLPFVFAIPKYSHVYDKVQPGDILMDVNGEPVGPDLIKCAKIFDQALLKEDQTVCMTVYRNGEKISFKVPMKPAFIPDKILSFAGSIIAQCDMSRAAILGIPPGTPILTQIDPGTLFYHEVAPVLDQNKYALVIHEVDNIKIKSFDHLVEVLDNLRKTTKDFNMKCTNVGVYYVYNREFMLGRDLNTLALSFKTENDRMMQLFKRNQTPEGDHWEIVEDKGDQKAEPAIPEFARKLPGG